MNWDLQVEDETTLFLPTLLLVGVVYHSNRKASMDSGHQYPVGPHAWAASPFPTEPAALSPTAF